MQVVLVGIDADRILAAVLGGLQHAQARRAGLDDARMVEVVAQVACMTLSNYLNNLAQTEIDFPV